MNDIRRYALINALECAEVNAEIRGDDATTLRLEREDLSEITKDMHKADRYKWHDLRKNPKDFPKGEKRILDIVPVQPDSFERYYGWFDGEHFIDQNGFSFNAIAWRETEPFEEVGE